MSITFTFNLVDEPWIPCLDANGRSRILNLPDLFAQAHQLRQLQGESPLVTAALHRFLLAILHRVFGPAAHEDWEDLWQAEAWPLAELNRYFDAWHGRFDLFATERPFYQATDERVKAKSIINLNHDRASGNNPTFFDHHTEAVGESLTPAQAARTLITMQAYGLAGLSGIPKNNFSDGTCAGGILFLVTGETLKETLLLNMGLYPPDNDFFEVHSAQDKPAWEMDTPFVPNRNIPFGYLDYLTWQNRQIMLLPEEVNGRLVVRQMTMGPALQFDSSLLDPMKHYRPDKKLGHVAISFSENRVLWRDSATLLQFHADKSGNHLPPATLRWINELVDDTYLAAQALYQLTALGMSKKQAKVNFYRAEQLPLPLAYFDDEKLVNRLQDALIWADTLAFNLLVALRRMGIYLQEADADNKKWGELNSNTKSSINDWVAYTGSERHFWTTLDFPFQKLVVDLPQDAIPALADWRIALQNAANDAFQQATNYVGEDGRSFKAIVRGESYLRYRINELFPKKETTV